MKLRNEMSMIYWVVVGMGVGMESNLVSKKDKRHCFDLMNHRLLPLYAFHVCLTCGTRCGRPWPAAYINFNQNIHQIQVLTKPLCRAQAIFYWLPNNEWGTKYRGLTYSAK